MTDQVTLKAEKLLEARERHQQKIEEKHRIEEKRRVEEERLRIRNISLRQQGFVKRERQSESIKITNQVRHNSYIHRLNF